MTCGTHGNYSSVRLDGVPDGRGTSQGASLPLLQLVPYKAVREQWSCHHGLESQGKAEITGEDWYDRLRGNLKPGFIFKGNTN